METRSTQVLLARPDKRTFKERLRELSLMTKIWWGTGPVLATIAFLGRLFGWTCLWLPFLLLFIVWVVPSGLAALYWLWRKLTYRISVRFFISYLLIGVFPLPLLAAIGVLGAYMLIGQFTSGEFSHLEERLLDAVTYHSDEALSTAESGRNATAVLQRGPRMTEDLADAAEHAEWIYVNGGATRTSAGLEGTDDATPPDWLTEEKAAGRFRMADGGPALAAITRRGSRLVAVILPLDKEVADQLNPGLWYRLTFLQDEADFSHGFNFDGSDLETEDTEAEAGTGSGADEAGAEEAGAGADANGADGAGETVAIEAEETPRGFLRSLWEKRWIYFAHLSEEPRSWATGKIRTEKTYPTWVQTSPQAAATFLFRLPPELGRTFWGIFAGFSVMLALVYAAAVFLATMQIVSITRATSRLTTGARQVRAGRLDHRIPVWRRDQLGDLAVAFNKMTESIEIMLEEVAEKERLKQELELAREIQQSLLPGNELQHGSISVRAYFRPAAEVGGDYFDLFPLEPGKLLVAAGDVAGHGLSTGLLMAMVKSAVATLIQEGHRGPDLLERLNQFMLQQPREHRMVTLALAEIDLREKFAEITNAAHPPAFISHGEVQEVMLPALPVGTPWRRRPPSERLALEPGSRLVFYSDGLVEAINDDEEPFGYDQLRDHLQANASAPSQELMTSLLAALEAHTGGRPLDDDLTILIIDCGVAELVAPVEPDA